MRPSVVLALGLLLLVSGIGLLAVGFMTGGAHFALIVIIPVIYGSSLYVAAGGALLVFGIFLTFLGGAATAGYTGDDGPLPSSASSAGGSKTSYGGFLLIGPVPIVFGNRGSWLPYLLVMGLITVLAVILVVLLY